MAQVSNDGPLLVFEWSDSLPTGAIGWYVCHSIVNHVCGGGITMSKTTTQQEVADIAFNMAKKFTVCDPQIGGSKGGIRFDSEDPRARGVLRRYIIAMRQIFTTFVNTAGDAGVDDALVERVFHEDLGLETCQQALGKMIAEKTGQPNLNWQLAKLIPFPANQYFPLIEAAVGYGLMSSIQTTMNFAPVHLKNGVSLCIQGFGAVGSSLAYYASLNVNMSVVAIADKDGFIYTDEKCSVRTIPVERLLYLRQQHTASLKTDSTEHQSVSKNFFTSLVISCENLGVHVIPRDAAWTNEEYLSKFLERVRADVFCPCAGRYVITKNIVNTLMHQTWENSVFPCVASGANNPFGIAQPDGTCKEDKMGILSQLLEDNSVCQIPDYVANSGTAQLFHRGLSVPFVLQDPKLAQHVLTACAEPIEDFLDEAFATCNGELAQLNKACKLITQKRLCNPKPVVFSGICLKNQQITKEPQDNDDDIAEIKCVDVTNEEWLKAREASEARNLRSQPHKLIDVANAVLQHMKRMGRGDARIEIGDDACIHMVETKTNDLRTSYYALPKQLIFIPGYQEVDERVRRVLSVGVECVDEIELKALMCNPQGNLVAYDGFEPSGRMHLAQGLMKKAIVNEMTACGFTFIFWVADFFAVLNLKQGGDMAKIKLLGEYFIEVWKSVGMNMERVKFLWAFDEIMKRPKEYLELVFDISTKFNLTRIKKSMTALGRSEDEKNLQASQILYPIFQTADIFFLEVGVCQLGLDQRKINMLAREYNHQTLPKPIVLSHTMLPGLKKGQTKMSKSDPASSIFMTDSEEEVNEKIKKAYCAEQDVFDNPCLMYYRHIIFPNEPGGVVVKTESGVKKHYDNYDALEIDFADGSIFPTELKRTLAQEINLLLAPVRRHFIEDARAAQLLAAVRSL